MIYEVLPGRSLDDLLGAYRKGIEEKGYLRKALDSFRKLLDQYNQDTPEEAIERLAEWTPKSPLLD